MGAVTAIDWTGSTWNFLRGCQRTSPGCGGKKGVGGCYAERTGGRFCGPGMAYEGLVQITPQGARWTGKVKIVLERLADPIRWQRPRRIFTASVSDPFYKEVSNEVIAAMFGIMAVTPRHTHQPLTKRAERMPEWFNWVEREARALRLDPVTVCMGHAADLMRQAGESKLWERTVLKGGYEYPREGTWPLANVWIGVSAENQEEADRRLPFLRHTPAAVRYVSVEPQLELVRLRNYLGRPHNHGPGPHGADVWTGGVDWVICGAESGTGNRPFDPAWARALRDECAEFGVPFFYKQDAKPNGKKIRQPKIDGQVCQEFPR